MTTNISLTTEQEEILHLLSTMSVQEVANRRGTSRQAVYKIMRKLKAKGYKIGGLQKRGGTRGRGVVRTGGARYWRIHGGIMRVSVLFHDKARFYRKSLKLGNVTFVKGHKVHLYPDCLVIDAKRGFDVTARDREKAMRLYADYWMGLVRVLENRMRLTLIKEEKQNIVFKNIHVAEVNNEIAKDYVLDKKFLHVYGSKDGVLWSLVDLSPGMPETEFVHPERADPDSERLNDWLNDVRDFPSTPLPSEMSKYALLSQQQLLSTTTALNAIAKSLSLIAKYNEPVVPDSGLNRVSKRSKPEYVG